jgi:hypothetical protein
MAELQPHDGGSVVIKEVPVIKVHQPRAIACACLNQRALLRASALCRSVSRLACRAAYHRR